MKRELKGVMPEKDTKSPVVTQHVPMKRELKDMSFTSLVHVPEVTQHVPMKRELKDLSGTNDVIMRPRYTACPNEEGTERCNTQNPCHGI